MRKIILLCCVLSLAACSSKNKVKISGSLSRADSAMIYLDEVNVYNTIPIDSMFLKKNGRFRFNIDSRMPSFYQLRVASQIIVLFPKPGEKIKIEGDAKDLMSTLKIDGSHDTEQIIKLIEMLNDTKTKLDSLALLYENVSDTTSKSRVNNEYQAVLENHRKSSIAYLLTNYNSLSCVYALYQQYQPGYYVFYKTTDIQFFKIVSDSLSKYHPGSKHVEALKVYTDNLIGDYNLKKILQHPTASVDVLPAIRLPDFSGDTATLYSLKGKYVLLSFWTSKNQVCINQNLELKKIYAKYRGKNFEIFQVAFDNSRESWQRAVRFDELPWISVIDERYPNSSIAGNFNVTQLPFNYLIDKDNSSIIGKNLTPAQLQDKLQDIYN